MRRSAKRGDESFQRTLTVLAGRGEVTANLTEHLGPFFAAETARHFLLHLDRADISLRLVVVERHLEIMHEGQHVAFALRAYNGWDTSYAVISVADKEERNDGEDEGSRD